MDQVLQAGNTSGVSATSAFRPGAPKHVANKHTGKNILPASIVPTAQSRVAFPTANPDTPVHASWLCIGAWPWGDKATWHWRDEELAEVKAAWRTLFAAGINFVDTAQAYGADHSSEEIVGQVIAEVPRADVVVQTKYFPPSSSSSSSSSNDKKGDDDDDATLPIKALEGSLKRLQTSYVDIYLVHGPIHPTRIRPLAQGLAHCVARGLTRAVGVANYDAHDLQRLRDELAVALEVGGLVGGPSSSSSSSSPGKGETGKGEVKGKGKGKGIPLATHQAEYSVLRRVPETSGEIRACAEHDMVFQASSSLAQGRLTGKYTAAAPPPDTYRFARYDMAEVEPVVAVLREIGQQHAHEHEHEKSAVGAHASSPGAGNGNGDGDFGGAGESTEKKTKKKKEKSVAAVALNYNMSKGTVPVVGIRNRRQAEEALEAFGWRLTEEEIVRIDEVAFEGNKTRLWQQG